jgi:hypothetical protein
MEFRTYDPAIGRFNGIDPVTHHSQGTSVAFDNNPVFWADPSGANSSLGSAILGLTPFTEEWKERAGFSTLGINGLLEQAAKNDKEENPNDEYDSNGGKISVGEGSFEYECPDCDNVNILLDFITDTAMSDGEYLARKRKLGEEYFYDDIYSYGEVTQITGNKNLDYKTGKKNIIKYIFAGTVDKNDYYFRQKFQVKHKGKVFNLQADGYIYIQKNIRDMNISFMESFLTMSPKTQTNSRINFYNHKGKLISFLQFGNEHEAKHFWKKYYYEPRKESYDRIKNEKK